MCSGSTVFKAGQWSAFALLRQSVLQADHHDEQIPCTLAPPLQLSRFSCRHVHLAGLDDPFDSGARPHTPQRPLQQRKARLQVGLCCPVGPVADRKLAYPDVGDFVVVVKLQEGQIITLVTLVTLITLGA